MDIEDLSKMLTNPYYAVNVSDTVATPHTPLVTKHEFVDAFTIGVMRNDEGKRLEAPEDIEARLRKSVMALLNNLESDEIPYGYRES